MLRPPVPSSTVPLDAMAEPPAQPDSDWDLVRDAGDAASPTCKASRDAVTVRYYGAIFAYVRQTGRGPDDARELTQGFIADVLLGRDLLSRVDTRRGQFCTLLMHAVRNYVNDRYRHDHAAKRHPGETRLAALDHIEPPCDTNTQASSPESAFHRAWVRRLIEEAAERLHVEQRERGTEWMWDIFDRRVLLPMLRGETPIPYEQLIERWKLQSPAQVSNAIVRMRHAFARHLLECIGSTVDSPSDARDELRRLLLSFDRSNP